jgi:Iron-dependent Transcriptional regulator
MTERWTITSLRTSSLRFPGRWNPVPAILIGGGGSSLAMRSFKYGIARSTISRRRGFNEACQSVLQALVRDGILKATRGPRGGYELAREEGCITADDILRAAGTAVELDCTPVGDTALLRSVVLPVWGKPKKLSPPNWRASASRIWRSPPLNGAAWQRNELAT